MLTNTWCLAGVPYEVATEVRELLVTLRLINYASHEVVDRPDR